tara:strand:- start:200 stop:913 length:714 start_codon:yes stop_codon:yes gene_type:complete
MIRLNIVVFLAIISMHLALAQGDIEEEYVKSAPEIETPAEREARMLAQFDRSIVSGQMVFSFSDDTTKEEAVAILGKYGLKLQLYEVCGSTVGPVQTPDGTGEELYVEEESNCETVDSWSDMIKVATVDVPEGEEKNLAKKLVNEEEQIVWAEPSHLIQLGIEVEGNLGVPVNLPPKTSEPGEGCLEYAYDPETDTTLCVIANLPEGETPSDEFPEGDTLKSGWFESIINWFKGLFG